MNSNPTTAQVGPNLPILLEAGSGTSLRNSSSSTLAILKNRLLRETLKHGAGAPLANLLRLAAVEAEAQAWLTSFPLLLFPTLFEEKVSEARSYVAHQRRLRGA
jgi:hypothetical protein